MIGVAVGGEQLLLLPQHAAFVPAHGTLLVADVHLGKAVSFRRLGVPVPEATTDETLSRLTSALARSGARRLIFLGDFLHSAHARAAETMAAVQRWRERHAGISMTLVRGNHDRRAGDPPAALGIEVVDERHPLGALRLGHHPRPDASGYVLAGHLHPCVNVRGRANDRLRLPCFCFGREVGVLPAFGAFTGMHPIERAPGDRLFVVAGDEVRELP